MSNIYSAKFMNEASATLADKVFKRPVSETYLFSTMNALREMNAVINEKTENLYIQIAEAESKDAENKIFANYFYEFKNVFQEFANKIQQMKSRMVITVENKVETWNNLLTNDNYIAAFDKEFSYSGFKFDHIYDHDYPRLNLYKVYQKEFDYLGQLMQDNSVDASPNAKLKIVASVSNNFNNYAKNSTWVKDLIKDMIDIDEKEISRSYSECIYNALRDKYEINVDKGMLYTCKENLLDYENAADAAIKMCDNLMIELNRVAENISSYLFRNNDKKLKIKTDTDGIIDRDYQLDTYSMNQLDLFLKNKINQIKKVLNMYSIAIGIKFDTVIDFIDQNINILKTASDYSVSDEEVEDNREEIPEDDSMEEPEQVDDETEDDDVEYSDNNMNDGDDTPIQEEPEDDYEIDFGENEESEDGIEEQEDFEIPNQDSEDFEESTYLFESEMFELELMYEAEAMFEMVCESLVLEAPGAPATGTSAPAANKTDATPSADNSQSGDSQQQTSNNQSNLKKIANKEKDPNAVQKFIQKIIEKLKQLWEKFKGLFVKSTKEKIKYLNDNVGSLKKTVTANCKLSYTPNITLLDKITIPDLNYGQMAESLSDEDTFVEKYFKSKGEPFKGDGSLSDNIKEAVLGKPQEEEMPANKQTIPVMQAYDFCKGYEARINKLEKLINTLNRAEKVSKDVSKVEESAKFDYYFNEMEGEKVEKSEKGNKLKVYFNVCSRVLAASMTCHQKIFNEYYSYCVWYIGHAGGGTPKQEEKQEG